MAYPFTAEDLTGNDLAVSALNRYGQSFHRTLLRKACTRRLRTMAMTHETRAS